MTQTLGIKLTGGLGNQLFQIASTLSLSQIFSRQLVVYANDFVSRYKLHPLLAHEIFGHELFSFNSTPRLSRVISERHLGYDPYLVKTLRKCHSLPIDSIVLNGYLQSLSYFSHNLISISGYLRQRLNTLLSDQLTSESRQIIETSVGVHIRGRDKLTKTNSRIYFAMQDSILIKCIESIRLKKSAKCIILYGDDLLLMHKIKSKFSSAHKVLISSEVVGNSTPLLDFLSLSMSKALILSNSTFSIWAGYISDSDVYCSPSVYNFPPDITVCKHKLEDLYLPHWVQL